MQRILSFAARTAVACAFMGVVGCATMRSISINSTPSLASVEIRRMDGTVVGQGQTPMTADLEHGKDYTVTISLAGYQTQTIPVKSITDHNFDPSRICLGALCAGPTALAGGDPDDLDDTFDDAGIPPVTDPEYKLNPSTIHVQLKEVTTLDGSDTAIYVFLSIVYENGRHQYAIVEMTRTSSN